MKKKAKRAVIHLTPDLIYMECPFCGMRLLRTDYKKIAKLLNHTQSLRGQVCGNCEGVVVLNPNTKMREEIITRLGKPDASS
jgi:transcription elongation factor Elf1